MAAAGSYKVRVMSLDGIVKDESSDSFTLRMPWSLRNPAGSRPLS